MKALLRYSFMTYMRNHHYLFPFVLIMMYSVFLYSTLAVFDTGGIFLVSLTILFMTALLNGFFSNRICSDDMRAIIVLKTGSAAKYYASNEVLFAILSTGYAILALVCPCVVCLFQTGQLSLRMSAGMLLIHLTVALFGYQFGSFFQSYLIGKRKSAVLVMLVMILGILLEQKLSMLPVIRHLLFIFPPVGRLFRLLYTGRGSFDAETGYVVIQLVIDTLIFLVGKTFILSRRKWSVYE
ncbi:MAG: hypothetical protein NC409_05455 [Clostridium sp.]|nr:hypothetical protein [Clostridium sp.]